MTKCERVSFHVGTPLDTIAHLVRQRLAAAERTIVAGARVYDERGPARP